MNFIVLRVPQSGTKHDADSSLFHALRDEQIAIGTRENETLIVTKIIQRYPAHQLKISI